MPYRTTVLAGSIDVGDFGIRVLGIVWLGLALAFAVCSIGVFTRQSWAWSLTAWTASISLAMCAIGWPDSRIGVFVNAAIIAALLIAPKEASRSVQATGDEQTRPLPGDDLISAPIGSMTHAITIDASAHDVWPWIAQMGAGNRAGWYSYDFIDNGRQRSARQIMPELQNLKVGMLFPALPGAMDGFTLASFETEQFLVLQWKMPDEEPLVTWTFVLERLENGLTRLIVRARGGPGYHFHGLPWPLVKRIIPVGHFIMQRKQLLGIAERAEAYSPTGAQPTTQCQEGIMSHISAFKSPEGEAAYLAAYDAAMKLWPAPYEEFDIPSRFGTTHVVASGPNTAPPLVLLHGYMATSTMWSPNITAVSKEHRVYALDVMGQPSKSVPGEPIRNVAGFVSWLTGMLDALHLDRVSLVGQSFGGWLALNYAIASPQRLRKLVLLSPGGLLPMARQFTVRGMLMLWFPTRLTVNSFMRWLGLTDRAFAPALDLMYLGMKHFRMPLETARIMPVSVSDEKLRTLHVPTLLLYGDHEVICNPGKALERARRLIPDFQGELVPESSHDMCASQHEIVDARVLDFLKKTPADDRGAITERSVA